MGAVIEGGFHWLARHAALNHCLMALALMGILVPALRRFGVGGAEWHAAAYTSVYFYARESAQAERALLSRLGDPGAFYYTLWPGNWTAGGHLDEWLAPTALAYVLAIVLSGRSRHM